LRTRELKPNRRSPALLLAVATLAVTAMFLWACSSHQDRGAAALDHDGPQRPEAEPPDPEARFRELRQRLSLTDGQAEEVREILETERRGREELMSSSGGRGRQQSDEMRTKMEDLEWKTLTGLSKILTREQMDAYLEYLDEEKAKRPERGPGGKGPKGGRPPERR